MMRQKQLVELNDSVLVVIDVQRPFVQKLPPDTQGEMVARIGWLVQVAVALSVPLLVTAEDIPNCGGVVPEVAACLPEETAVYNKLTFNLADQPDILAAIVGMGRKTAVLVGLETDVCVAQSALGLLAAGFNVAAVVDAVGSPGLGQEVGLGRMQAAGVALLSAKSLYYEWIRTVPRDNAFKVAHLQHIPLPQSILL
mgnify:CR=1 FL=1